LIEERARLLVRLDEIAIVLERLERGAKAVAIYTNKNLRNTGLGYYGVSVYSDEALTTVADSASHGGWVTSEDAAVLGENDVYGVEIH